MYTLTQRVDGENYNFNWFVGVEKGGELYGHYQQTYVTIFYKITK